jgi:hypothetical protein
MHLVPNILVYYIHVKIKILTGVKRIISEAYYKAAGWFHYFDSTVSPMASLKSKHIGELYKANKCHIPTKVYWDHTKSISTADKWEVWK